MTLYRNNERTCFDLVPPFRNHSFNVVSEPNIQAHPQNDPVLESTAQYCPRMRSYRVAADSLLKVRDKSCNAVLSPTLRAEPTPSTTRRDTATW